VSVILHDKHMKVFAGAVKILDEAIRLEFWPAMHGIVWTTNVFCPGLVSFDVVGPARPIGERIIGPIGDVAVDAAKELLSRRQAAVGHGGLCVERCTSHGSV